MTHDPLDCLRCPSLCCRMAGYVEVSSYDIKRLAKHLGLTPTQFDEKHVVERKRRGKKRIKAEFATCQFLGADRRCTVYEARPTDCRGYVCWDHDDMTVFKYARFLQTPVAKLRKIEQQEEADA